MVIPILSFHMNHEFIRSHHCRSLTEPGFEDCDGFCYLKKQLETHQDHAKEHHSSAGYVPKVPFLYLPEIKRQDLGTPFFSQSALHLLLKEQLPDAIFRDILSPPPKA